MQSHTDLIIVETTAKEFALAAKFTPRETQLFRLLLAGTSQLQDLARSCGTSPNTARNQLRSMYRKTNTSGKAELLAKYLRFTSKHIAHFQVLQGGPRVLFYSAQRFSAELLAWLDSCGVEVQQTSDKQTALKSLAKHSVDGLVIDSSLPDSTELVDSCQKLVHASTPVLQIHTNDLQSPEKRFELVKELITECLDSPFSVRRRIRVHELALTASVDHAPGFRIANLAFEGVFLVCEDQNRSYLETWKNKTDVHVRFELPNGDLNVESLGRLVWRRAESSPFGDAGFGVHFPDLNAEERGVLRRFVVSNRVQEILEQRLPSS